MINIMCILPQFKKINEANTAGTEGAGTET